MNNHDQGGWQAGLLAYYTFQASHRGIWACIGALGSHHAVSIPGQWLPAQSSPAGVACQVLDADRRQEQTLPRQVHKTKNILALLGLRHSTSIHLSCLCLGLQVFALGSHSTVLALEDRSQPLLHGLTNPCALAMTPPTTRDGTKSFCRPVGRRPRCPRALLFRETPFLSAMPR